MESVVRVGERELWAGRLTRPFRFESPYGGEDFVMLLAILDDTMSVDEQGALSDAFIAQGCRYAVCWGHDCTTWDDSIDWSFLETDPDSSPPDDRFVMTTWHDDEPLDEVAEFFVLNTTFDDFVPIRFLVVTLGGTPDEFARVRDAVVSCVRWS